MVLFSIVVRFVVTGYVFDHAVGVRNLYALNGQSFKKLPGSGVAEDPLDGVCRVAVLEVPVSVSVLGEVAEAVLTVGAGAFDGNGSEAVIIFVNPGFPFEKPVIVLLVEFGVKLFFPIPLMGGIIDLLDVVINGGAVVYHIGQDIDVDCVVFVVVLLALILVFDAGDKTDHNDGQHQYACQNFENFALHFGSPCQFCYFI